MNLPQLPVEVRGVVWQYLDFEDLCRFDADLSKLVYARWPLLQRRNMPWAELRTLRCRLCNTQNAFSAHYEYCRACIYNNQCRGCGHVNEHTKLVNTARVTPGAPMYDVFKSANTLVMCQDSEKYGCTTAPVCCRCVSPGVWRITEMYSHSVVRFVCDGCLKPTDTKFPAYKAYVLHWMPDPQFIRHASYTVTKWGRTLIHDIAKNMYPQYDLHGDAVVLPYP